MASEQPRSWYSWLSLAEFWYNTNFHSSTKITPFQVVYGQPPPIHTPYLPGSTVVEVVDRSLAAREKILHLLKHNLRRAQHRMKQVADAHRTDREFAIGDLVYVKLHPYKQHSLKSSSCQKLAPRYFGPFPVVERIGKVAYKLQLPDHARIHPIFHVSLLTKNVGSHVVAPQLQSAINDRSEERRVGTEGSYRG